MALLSARFLAGHSHMKAYLEGSGQCFREPLALDAQNGFMHLPNALATAYFGIRKSALLEQSVMIEISNAASNQKYKFRRLIYSRY